MRMLATRLEQLPLDAAADVLVLLEPAPAHWPGTRTAPWSVRSQSSSWRDRVQSRRGARRGRCGQ
jgi:hypothetical protein